MLDDFLMPHHAHRDVRTRHHDFRFASVEWGHTRTLMSVFIIKKFMHKSFKVTDDQLSLTATQVPSEI